MTYRMKHYLGSAPDTIGAQPHVSSTHPSQACWQLFAQSTCSFWLQGFFWAQAGRAGWGAGEKAGGCPKEQSSASKYWYLVNSPTSSPAGGTTLSWISENLKSGPLGGAQCPQQLPARDHALFLSCHPSPFQMLPGSPPNLNSALGSSGRTQLKLFFP